MYSLISISKKQFRFNGSIWINGGYNLRLWFYRPSRHGLSAIHDRADTIACENY
jgi:hypothetical protein